MLFTHNKEGGEAKPKRKALQQVIVHLCCHDSMVKVVHFMMTVVYAGQFLSCQAMQKHCNLLMTLSANPICSWLWLLPNSAVASLSQGAESNAP